MKRDWGTVQWEERTGHYMPQLGRGCGNPQEGGSVWGAEGDFTEETGKFRGPGGGEKTRGENEADTQFPAACHSKAGQRAKAGWSLGDIKKKGGGGKGRTFVGRERICLKNYSPEGKKKQVLRKQSQGSLLSAQRHCSHLKPFLTICHMHINDPAWYLNKLILDGSWEFSKDRSINGTAEKHIKESLGRPGFLCVLDWESQSSSGFESPVSFAPQIEEPVVSCRKLKEPQLIGK